MLQSGLKLFEAYRTQKILFTFADIKEAFALFDRNGDGKISCSEVGMVLKKMGYNFTTKELGKMLERVDKDGG